MAKCSLLILVNNEWNDKRGKVRGDLIVKFNASERPEVAFAFKLTAYAKNLSITYRTSL
jgi:hypothetical protein